MKSLSRYTALSAASLAVVMGAPDVTAPNISALGSAAHAQTPPASDLLLAERMSDFGSSIIDVTVPQSSQTIADIEVRFVDGEESVDGKTRDHIITREFDLAAGDRYDAELAEQGLQRVNNLEIVSSATLTLEPTDDPNQAVMVITVDERSPFPLAFSLTLPQPTALQGPVVPETVLPGTDREGGTLLSLSLERRNVGGNNQTAALGIEGGENTFNYAFSFTDPWIGDSNRTGYTVNFFNSREVSTIFDGGDEVELSNDRDPWVHRIGGGFDVFRPVSPSLAFAAGLSFQRVSVRDSITTDDIFTEDELGNELTFGDEGRDSLLTLSFAGALDRRDDRELPTEGYQLLFRSDQYVPVGESSIAGNRLAANYTQYLPVPLFGFDDGPRTLILNVQGGTFIGDLPPYEAFALGGGTSVRGYDAGEIGSGRSFAQATAEYRFPIFDFVAFQEEIDVGGALFVDYATDLGSGDTVRGEPAEVRDKPGEGLGFGVGLRALTPVGPARLELGINDDGESEVIFTIGDRF
ncbi:MAG: BamA/TamA family outer membrane protein [Elainellaceae cyanobacterium]